MNEVFSPKEQLRLRKRCGGSPALRVQENETSTVLYVDRKGFDGRGAREVRAAVGGAPEVALRPASGGGLNGVNEIII